MQLLTHPWLERAEPRWQRGERGVMTMRLLSMLATLRLAASAVVSAARTLRLGTANRCKEAHDFISTQATSALACIRDPQPAAVCHAGPQLS
jgi:hypothetical protein